MSEKKKRRKKNRHGVKGYIVVQRDGGQIKEYLRRLADDADEDAF